MYKLDFALKACRYQHKIVYKLDFALKACRYRYKIRRGFLFFFFFQIIFGDIGINHREEYSEFDALRFCSSLKISVVKKDSNQ